MPTGYPIEIADADSGSIKIAGVCTFTDPDCQPGAHWFDGGGAPSDLFGLDGDYYLDVDSGNVWRKDGGSWA